MPVEKQIFLAIFDLPLEWSSIRFGLLREALGVVQSTGMRTKK